MWLLWIILTVLFWIFAGLVAIILLLLPLRIGLMAQYDKEGVAAFASLGPVRVKVYPRPKKEPKKKKEKPAEEPKPEIEVPEKGGTVDKLKAGLSIVGPILREVRRRLIISEITLHYTAATQDAAKTALLYGGAHATVSQMLLMIRQNFRVKKQDVQIRADFEGGEDLVFLRVKIAISVWGAICLGIFGFRKARKSGLI